VAAFASPAWIDNLRAAAATASVHPDLRLTIEQRIIGDEPVAWHLAFADGSVAAAEGPADNPTITLTSNRETAIAIESGMLSSQRAFLDGDLRIGGDLHMLIETRGALAEFAAILASAAT